MQFANKSYRWGLIASDALVERGNWIILLWEMTFLFASIIKVKFVIKRVGIVEQIDSDKRDSRLNTKTVSFLAILLMLLGIFTVARGGYLILFNRTIYGKSTIISLLSNSSLRMIGNALITGFALWVAISTLTYYKEHKSLWSVFLVIVALVALIFNVPPTGVPRYEATAVYGGILISRWKRLKKDNLFFYLLAIGLLIVFPLLNSFRGTIYGHVTFEAVENSLGDIGSNFLRADYDAYSMLLYTLKYVEQMGMTHGMQLVGALLFFIPSSIWAGKPGGSGALIIDQPAADYNSNVSCPLPAEGYINFGVIGTLLFALVFSYILRYQDRKYWEKDEKLQNDSMLYACALPFVLFMMRGDLMSTLAFFVGFSISLMIYRRVVYR